MPADLSPDTVGLSLASSLLHDCLSVKRLEEEVTENKGDLRSLPALIFQKHLSFFSLFIERMLSRLWNALYS